MNLDALVLGADRSRADWNQPFAVARAAQGHRQARRRFSAAAAEFQALRREARVQVLRRIERREFAGTLR